MQIKYLLGSVYKLYHYAATETITTEQIKQRKKYLGDWETLKAHKVADAEIDKITGISCATYYKLKKALRVYGLRGLEQRSKRPRRFRQSKIPKGTAEIRSQM